LSDNVKLKPVLAAFAWGVSLAVSEVVDFVLPQAAMDKMSPSVRAAAIIFLFILYS
jgi:hypothetical protein